MATEIAIIQHWVVTKFILPFLLIWVIVFAILEKTNVLGEGKHQVNALVSLVIGLIFVGVAYPKEVVGNLILFLTVALVVVFVGLLIWGFVSGGNLKADIFSGKVKTVVAIVVIVVVLIALLWSAGVQVQTFDFLFGQDWSASFWTNVIFLVVIAVAIALVLRSAGPK